MHKIFSLDYFNSIYILDNDEVLRSFIRINDYKYFNENDDNITHEYRDLYILTELLFSNMSVEQKNGYFLGFKLGSKIDEEFDLLRFSNDCIVNIEIKTQIPEGGLEVAEDQLKRHKFILSVLNKEIHSYIFIASENSIYKLDENNSILKTDFNDLITNIDKNHLNNNELEGIDVNEFIVSPYSNPGAFKDHAYYLSQDQRDKKLNIMKSSNKKVCIEGEAGTGKTLLLYDIAKELNKENHNVLMLFCGKLENHEQLTEIFGFPVKPIKYFQNYIKYYDVIMVDEAQRIYENQFDEILELEDKKFFFAFDYRQVLSLGERNRRLFEKYREDKNFEFIKLKNKIRTNHETIAFIEKLLKSNVRYQQDYNYKNINVSYFDSNEKSSEFIKSLNDRGYKSIELTEYTTRTSGKRKRKNLKSDSLQVHDVIGREYEDIVVILDSHYYYDDDGCLCSNYSEYYPYLEIEGIYQALTRTKGKIFLVIIDNPEVYISVQKIFTKKFEKTLSK